MSKRATKQETELRVAHAAELITEGRAYLYSGGCYKNTYSEGY